MTAFKWKVKKEKDELCDKIEQKGKGSGNLITMAARLMTVFLSLSTRKGGLEPPRRRAPSWRRARGLFLSS